MVFKIGYNNNFYALIRKAISDDDIIMNNVATIPHELLNIIRNGKLNEDDYDDLMLEYFYKKLKYNIIGIHLTRLFDYEIDDIIHNGINSDETESYITKINNLPNEFNKYKAKLIEFVSVPDNKRSHGKIYFDVGNISIDEDNEVFLRNWGGETLYCYFDGHNVSKDKHLLGEKLNKQSNPCMVIVRINAYTFFTEFPFTKYWIEKIKEYNVVKFSNSHCVDRADVEIVDIMKI